MDPGFRRDHEREVDFLTRSHAGTGGLEDFRFETGSATRQDASRLDQRSHFVPEREQLRLVLLDLGEAAELLEEVVVGQVVIDLRNLADEDGSGAGSP